MSLTNYYPITPYDSHHPYTHGAYPKTPFGYGHSKSLVPFQTPIHHGFDMTRALTHPMAFADQMTRALSDPTRMDVTVRSMEHAMQREMDALMRTVDRHAFMPSLTQHPSRPASIIEHYTMTNPIRIDAEGNRWLSCCFDMRAFKPEEINVTMNTKERTINVEATHEIKDRDHYIRRHYTRKFVLPETIKVDLKKLELKSCLTNEGLLCVESALPKATPEETSKTGVTTPSTFAVPVSIKQV